MMNLHQAIEDFFPNGVSRALLEIEQSHDGFAKNPTRVLLVNGNIYIGGTEPRNQVIGSRGGILVNDIPNITRISVIKAEIEGVTFNFETNLGIYIDVENGEDKNEIMYYILNYWEQYTNSPRSKPSAIHTKLKWVTTLQRSE